MREILFRGKRIDNGEWAYGNFVMDATEQVQRENIPLEPILADGFIRRYELAQQKIVMHEIDRETIGQYTGLTDKNGKKIFEGDIVTGLFLFGLSVNSVVTFKDGAFGLEWYRGDIKTFSAFTSICNVEYEVIGNIHDNSELLKGAK